VNNKKGILKFKVLGIFLSLVLILTSCSSPSKKETTTTDVEKKQETTVKTRKITNVDGTEYEIPEEITGVAPTIGAFAHITAMLGGSEKLVATIPNLSDLFKAVWPKTNPDGYDTSNIEDIIASGAQITYGPNYTEEQMQQLEAANIVTLKVNAFSNVEEMKNIVTLVGDILGDDAPEKAKEFNEYYDNNISYVKEKTKDLKEEEKIKVLNLRTSGGNYTTVNGKDISAEYAKAAGGIFVSDSYEGVSGEMTVNTEQILEWNPDVIFTMGAESGETIKNDPALANVEAVKNGKVFVEPSGTYPWSVRSAEGALMPLFLGKIMYPEIFEELSIEDETKKFYDEIYGYKLSEEEVEKIMAGEK